MVQAQEGNTAAAINKLESLQDKYPNHAAISEALAIAYAQHGNYLLSSNYYQKAARLSPDKLHLLKLSAEGQIKANRLEDAASRLKEYLETFPEDGATWLDLGRIQFGLNQKELAINSLMRGILLTNRENQKAQDHQMLGELYLEMRDFAQADYYLNSGLSLATDKTTEGQILAGLVQSSVAQEDWDVADLFLKRIEATQPELLATNEVKKLLETVKGVLELRDEGGTETVKVTITKPAPVEPSGKSEPTGSEDASLNNSPSLAPPAAEHESVGTDDTAPVVVVEPPEEEPQADKAAVDTTLVPAVATDAGPSEVMGEPELSQETSVAGSAPVEAASEVVIASISGGVAPMTNAVDVPGQTASKSEADSPLGNEITEPKPAVGSGLVITNEDSANDEKIADGEHPLKENPTADEPLPEALDPYEAPENEAELLLIQAQQAIADGNVSTAIRMAWDSVNKRPENPAGWFILSRAYVKFGQNLNAESAALEAMRLNPRNKKIVLNYLGILQRSRGANRFHEELLKAYQRFSTDPDFVLALARSYARIKNDPENAAALYRRFLDLAPDHQKAAEVRQEASFVE